MIALVAFLALLAPGHTAPASDAPASLRELVATSERIAWVRVEEVRAFDLGDSSLLRHAWPHGDVPLASVTVESSELGDGEPATLFVFAGDARTPGGGLALSAGMRALLFLERDSSFEWRVRRNANAQAFAAGRRLWRARLGGLWVVVGEGDALRRPFDGPPLATQAAPDVARAAFRAELDLALDLELPRFEVRSISTGPSPFRVVLSADGRLSGQREGYASTAELRALWRVVERERFGELPGLVGSSGGPCLTAMDLCLVTRRTRHSVGITLGGLAQIPAGDRRDATDRALRVWEALPIPDRPILR